MSKLDRLLSEFRAAAARPWSPTLAGPQRVWMVVYDESDERRLRVRLPEFEHAAEDEGHPMRWFDATDLFAKWMSRQEYRDEYFAYPEDLFEERGPLEGFRVFAAGRLHAALDAADECTVVGVVGVGALFGVLRVSELVESVHGKVPGRLAVFFPGLRAGNSYRLLDARDGWNYLALPISA